MADSRANDIILDSIADGVFTVDSQWRITSFNRAAEQITGVPRDQAVGQHCSDVFRANICESSCALKRTMKTGKPVVNQAVYIVDAAGRRVPVSISTAILKDAKGDVIGGVETFRDLSTVEQLRKELHEKYTFEDIIGRSHVMQQLFDILPRVAESNSTVLIEGSSGTGKELIARAIHNLSPRRDAPFLAVNCGALPDTLLESELFGYKAGAFTDARTDKPGRFAAAEGGTILLDEIGDISPAMQTRLLRVLQERVYEPLGSNQSQPINVRVIAATNRNLARLVEDGTFRQDLYYRIHVVRLELPALRDRREDIGLLIEHFIDKFNRLQNKAVGGLSDEATVALMAYDYPGNIRELENIIEHAFVLCRGDMIEPQHLPSALVGPEAVASNHRRGATLRELEAMHIVDTIRRHDGNRTAAARELGINPSTLFRKIKSMNIHVPD
jgi:PAS domain S-box-containing protein